MRHVYQILLDLKIKEAEQTKKIESVKNSIDKLDVAITKMQKTNKRAINLIIGVLAIFFAIMVYYAERF